VLCAVVLTQYRRVTDGQTDRWTDRQTDGIAVANTALSMRALRALKKINYQKTVIGISTVNNLTSC